MKVVWMDVLSDILMVDCLAVQWVDAMVDKKVLRMDARMDVLLADWKGFSRVVQLVDCWVVEKVV